MGHGGDVAALPHSRTARPSPLCNLNRRRPVKEFAQCFRAQAVGPAREANMYRARRQTTALTGESLPVAKKVGDEAYSGSIVKKGEMQGVVIATGPNTFFGRTAKLVAGAGAISHAQKAMFEIGNFL